LANKAARYYQFVPRWLRDRVIQPLTNALPESHGYRNKARVIREFARGGSMSLEQRYLRWTSAIKEETRHRLYQHPELKEILREETYEHLRKLFARNQRATQLNQMLYTWTKTMLPNDMLIKVDRMSMASSLEVRSPLLDHQLFEFAARLPDSAKLKGWTTKYLLRRLASKLLPKELARLPKRGFSIPLDRWLREDLADFSQEILRVPLTRSRGYFSQQAVDQLFKDHLSGRASYGREIWTLVTIELWHRMYIDESPSSACLPSLQSHVL